MDFFQLARAEEKNLSISRNKLYQEKEDVQSIQNMQRCYIKVDLKVVKTHVKL